MAKDLPIWIEEPKARKKADLLAQNLFKVGRQQVLLSKTTSIHDVKQQLKRIREYARDNLNQLTEELKVNLSQRYPQVKIKSAVDDAEAIKYIVGISDGMDTISTNNSSVISRELKPGLIAEGFKVVNSYLSEFDVNEKTILDYWDLPCLLENELMGSFDISIRMEGLDRSHVPKAEVKKYLAVLGVNAVSAEDGTVFFLEHFANIYRDLKQAERVILVISLDKIVRSKEEAAFVTECMGIFGMESILLGIGPKVSETPPLAELPLLPGDDTRELHIIILDNGRTNLLKTQFQDLLLCIGCRGCNRHCPIRYSFSDARYPWSPRNYLGEFLDGRSGSIDACLHCEGCRVDCPLDIDLPALMWSAKSDRITKHGKPFHRRILGRPELLVRFGTTIAPLANSLMNIKLVRMLMELTLGIDRKANLPKFHRLTFRKWYNKQ
jgi:L-lactate utilization protein LutB